MSLVGWVYGENLLVMPVLSQCDLLLVRELVVGGACL